MDKPSSFLDLERDFKQLKWARYALNELPNLPSGRLRDSIEERLKYTIDCSSGPVKGTPDPQFCVTPEFSQKLVGVLNLVKGWTSVEQLTPSQLADLTLRLKKLVSWLGDPDNTP